MKKTIKMPDGSEVVIEGTPEEVDEFERRQKIGDVSEHPKKGKKKLLLEEQFAEMMKKLDEIQKNRPYPYYEFHTHCVGCSRCQPWRELWPTHPTQPWTVPYWQQPWTSGGTWCGSVTLTSDKVELSPPAGLVTLETGVYDGTNPYNFDLVLGDCKARDPS